MKNPKVGDWGFIIGSGAINPDHWRRAFPANWFGKVIKVGKNYIELCCYRKDRTSPNKMRHPHLKTTKKYFKSL